MPLLNRAPSFSLRLLRVTLCLLLVLPPVTVAVPGRWSPTRAALLTPGSPGGATEPPPRQADRRDGEVLVRFRADASPQQADAATRSKGARRKRVLRGGSRVEALELDPGQTPEAVASALLSDPSVEFAEPNYLIATDDLTPNDARFAEQWALRNTGGGGGQTAGADVRAAQAWAVTTGSQQTVVAVVDSGIDFTHPDLKDNRWVNTREGADGRDNDRNGYTDDLAGWDWVGGADANGDANGHGTAVAGLIAARGDNGEGVAGVMWRARLMSLRVLDASGAGDVGRAVEAIDYAVVKGAQVINCSWGTGGQSRALRDAVERAAARGVLVVASAGNAGRDLDAEPYYPASYDLPNVIAVAATDASDLLAPWSNYGAKRVHVAAPGVEVLTTAKGGGYASVSGTSAAAPLVSGVAGLVKTVRPLLRAERTREAIIATTRRLAGLEGKVASGGVVDAAAALAAVAAWPMGASFDLRPGESNVGGGSARHQADLGGGTLGRRGGRDRQPVPPPRGGQFRKNQPRLDEARRRPSDPLRVPDPIPSQGRDYQRGEPVKAPGRVITPDYVGTGRYTGASPSVSRLDPTNRTGAGGEDLFSGNFNWMLPLVSLPGRAGLDLGLALAYNSLVWTKVGYSAVFFDEDRGFPSPGFRLGFPVVQSQFYNERTGKYAYMFVTPSGRRVELQQIFSSNIYESPDSSYLQLIDYGSWKLVRDTNGTQLTMVDDGAGQFKCTQVKDRNGNYLSVAYASGRISTVTDTLGRVVNFNYDGNGRLSTITQTRGGSTHTWATFGYSNLYVQPNFSGMWIYGPYYTTISVLTHVWTADSSLHLYDYNSFGQVYRVSHFAAGGNLRTRTTYNLPTGAQSDCPRVTERRDWVAHWNGDDDGSYSSSEEAVTSFGSEGDVQTVTLPDRTTVHKEFFHTWGWPRGLTYQTETWSGGVRKKWTTTNWTQDNTGLSYQFNPRVVERNVYDDEGNRRRRTTVDYHGSFGLPWIVTEYAADAATAIRRTYFDYRNDAAYIDRRIIGLLLRHTVYDGNWNLLVKNEFSYDWDWGGDMFQDTPAPATQHDRANYGPSFIYGRGNLSVVTRFDVNDPNNSQDTWQEMKFRHNSTGSVLMARDHLWHQKFISYGDSYADGVNRNTFAYPTTVTDEDNYSSTTRYDFHTGLVTRTQDPKGAVREMQYDAVGRLEKVTTPFNGAYTKWVYPSGLNYVQSFSTVNVVADESYAITLLDGAGRKISEGFSHPGSAGGYKGQHFVYDVMGRLVEQTNPGEMDGWWNPSGDDAAGWRSSFQTYDWQGRPRLTTNTDGTTRELTYDGCGCAGSQTVTARDEVSRRQRTTYDVLGRLWRVESLNTDWSVYRTSTNTYNARDQITQVDDQAAGGANQVTWMTYDGHGRLKTRQRPHESAPTTFNYRKDDAVESVTDPRGVTNTFSYNNRHLPTGVTFGSAWGVESTSNASFAYDEAGNRTQMVEAGLGQVNYAYNTLSQLTSETRTFNGLGGAYTLSYTYNLAGQVKSVTDPWNATTHYNHDSMGQVHSLTASGTIYAGVWVYASDIKYRAWGAVKSLTYGNQMWLSTSFDERMRVSRFEIGGRNPAYGPSTAMLTQYHYYGDGQLRFADDGVNDRFDRAYTYDHVGRLKEAFTGGEARDFVYATSGSPADGPYRQTYHYDAWGNVTGRDNRFWSQTDSFAATYVNNRRQGWQYDAAGNVLTDDRFNYKWDAAGRNREMGDPAAQRASLQWHDGDGQTIKRAIWQSGVWTEIEYLVRSTVLGGQVVTEINRYGQKTKGYVYAGGEVIAEQGASTSAFAWRHTAPLTDNRGGSAPGAWFWTAIEADPEGVNVGVEDPFVEPYPPGFDAQPEQAMLYPLFDGGCSSLNPTCRQCFLDGFAIGCDRAMHLMDIGAAVPCPNNDCGPRVTTITARGPDGRVIGSTSIIRLPGQPGWDGSLDGTYRVIGHGTLSFGSIVSNVTGFLGALTGLDARGIGEFGSAAFQRVSGGTGVAGVSFSGGQRAAGTERRLTPEEVRKLALGILDMLSDQTCRDFIRQLFDEVEAQTGVAPRGLLDTLFQVEAQPRGGIFTGDMTGTGTIAGGLAMGAIEYGNAKILLLPPIDYVGLKGKNAVEFQRNIQRRNLETLLHETMHQAGLSYHDVTFARALNAIRVRQGLEAPREFPLRGKTAQMDMINASNYWGPLLDAACRPKL